VVALPETSEASPFSMSWAPHRNTLSLHLRSDILADDRREQKERSASRSKGTDIAQTVQSKNWTLV